MFRSSRSIPFFVLLVKERFHPFRSVLCQECFNPLRTVQTFNHFSFRTMGSFLIVPFVLVKELIVPQERRPALVRARPCSGTIVILPLSTLHAPPGSAKYPQGTRILPRGGDCCIPRLSRVKIEILITLYKVWGGRILTNYPDKSQQEGTTGPARGHWARKIGLITADGVLWGGGDQSRVKWERITKQI